MKYLLGIYSLICQCKIATFQKFWTRICDEGYSSQHLLKICCWICASFTDITSCQDKMGQLLEGMTCLLFIKSLTSFSRYGEYYQYNFARWWWSRYQWEWAERDCEVAAQTCPGHPSVVLDSRNYFKVPFSYGSYHFLYNVCCCYGMTTFN